MTLLERILDDIQPADSHILRLAQERQNSLTKPPGSLGRLEELANRVCAMRGTLQPEVNAPYIFVFAADHGVCEEGVNPYPQSVTRQMVLNFLDGGAAINAIALSVGARLSVVDVGVAGSSLDDERLLSRRIAPGTQNFCRGAAMSQAHALAAINVGMDCADEAIGSGSSLLCIGEMGIGNTTTASALCAAITGREAALVCGKGTGSDETALARKQDAVRRALALHSEQIAKPIDLLARLGGFEIAAMVGVCIAGARKCIPVVMDGFISTVAAVIAVRMKPAVQDYLIAAHASTEPGHRALLEHIRLRPLLELEMRLGEGTGAALAIPLVRAALAAFRNMATFESAGVAEANAHG